MGRKCSVCAHPQRDEIEAKVAHGISYRQIASHFSGISSRSLNRHCANGHIVSMAVVVDVEPLSAGGVLAEMAHLRDRARLIEARATRSGKLQTALGAIREQSRIIENVIKLAALLKALPVEPAARVVDLAVTGGLAVFEADR